ncbi:protein translocase subunit SecD [Sulfurovum mangrovi]|uniref:protein translocase subunit SecD n=1 Tax=Sulfurovum mangrovi TaxID=2893889 RepID=UPI001E2CB9FA|nr:protein translocase subunit SecD [Sulfurovum mangrovi]UFH59593.1 protein translocase subunit SecD [Sulfurovum mangrovi]UFH60729.1 protein translocase subunit SecD [Sulfurovum mangrovi]
MLNYRVVIFAFALIFGVVFSIPSLMQSESGKKITLGLDLQGGLHMLLGVKNEVAIASKSKSIASSIKYIFDDEEIIFDALKLDEDTGVVTFEILDKDDIAKVNKLLKEELEGVTFSENSLKYSLQMTTEEIERTKKDAIDQAVDTIRGRLNEFGLAEPTVAKQGEDKILVEVPGIKTQEDEQRIRELIARAAHLQLMAVDEERIARVHSMSPAEAKSYGDVILPDVNTGEKYLLKGIPVLDGSMLTDAKVGFDENSQPVINFALNGQGAKIFGDFTAISVGKRMAVVLDNQVYSAPNIRERIGGGHVQISGQFTMEEAHDLAIALRSGSLLAPVYVMEKRSVGPSLGADSIKASSMALVLGFILVVIFMVIYYGMAGVVANVALIGNLFLILAIMSLFGATLTLPGMAGIVLTVGMAVDANVIINERIRELLNEGKSIAKSIEDGYKNAFTAIWDANVTTLIAATVLYAYGTGAIKGFALTMSIGIMASMLTAIVGTHGIYQWVLPKMDKNRLGYWFGIKGSK